jgi:hypothetical protein
MAQMAAGTLFPLTEQNTTTVFYIAYFNAFDVDIILQD